MIGTDQKFLEYYKKYYIAGPTLDVGCGWYGTEVNATVKFDKAASILGTPTCANVFGDFHYMPFKDESFSYVFSKHSIEHAENQQLAISEWARVLKVGGIFHITWPGWLLDVDEDATKSNNRDMFTEGTKALKEGDMVKYEKLGLHKNWISTGPTGKKFIDVHWDVCSLGEMLLRLPKCIKVLESSPIGDCIIVGVKE